MLVASDQARGASAPAFLTQFGANGKDGIYGEECDAGGGGCAKAGETAQPRGIATDPDTGHVFVVDQFNFRVDEFTPWGNFVKAFGWDVAPGPVDEEQEIRIRAAAGQFKLSFGANTTLDLPFNASAEEVETAVNGLASINSKGNVSVEEVIGNLNGTTPFVYIVRFDGGSLKATDVAQLGVENGTTPLSGGNPTTNLEARTSANGGAATTGLEACTAASGCKVGLDGTGAGQLDTATGVALDSAGAVYVVDRPNLRVEKFDSAGEFLWMVGGGVDKGPNHPGNLCTAAYLEEGDTCEGGSAGTGLGEFSTWPVSSYIAIGPGETVYVGDNERIQRFKSDGTTLAEIPLPAPIDKGTVSSLAVTATGEIYVSANGLPNVLRLSMGGANLCTINVGRPTAVALAGADGAYVFAERIVESEVDREREIRQYDSNCAQTGSFAEEEFEGSTGIGVNGIGGLYASNLSGSGVNSYIRAYGLPPIDYESPPPLAPEIIDEYAIAVKANSATVGAQINPKFWTDATYYVQYGKADCAVSICAETSPGVPLTTQSISAPVATAGVELPGLEPNVTYHYRFVTQSNGGGPAFGEDVTFRTHVGSKELADGRVAELVSPRLKDGGEAGGPPPVGGAAELTPQPQQTTPASGEVTYHSFAAFGDDPESAPATSQYLGRPLDAESLGSWFADNINPRFEEGFLRDPFVAFSEDLTKAAVIVVEPPLTPDATHGFPNLYVRDNPSGTLTAVTTKEHTPEISGIKPYEYCLYFGGASVNYERVFFAAKGALIEGDSKANGFNLYEWSAGEGLQLVSVLPDEVKATATLGTGFGAHPPSDCKTSTALLRHTVSADGSRAFWSYSGTFAGAKEPLFVRINASETVQLDASQGGPGKGGGEYQDASVDGSKVFFIDTKKLTNQPTTAESSDLYRYDFDQEEGQRLSNLTSLVSEKADVASTVATSVDGDYVYFVAKGVLDAEPNSEGETAKGGANNLYVWHESEGIRFLAVLATADQAAWSENPARQRARVSPNGKHLTFLSVNRLTGFDNEVVEASGCELGELGLAGSSLCAEAFLYDYSADTLVCASCGPSGARPHGPASLPAWATPQQQPRYLSDHGNRLFFETLDALDSNDTNEKRDVYEFEYSGTGTCHPASDAYVPASNSCLFLISSGKSTDESYFLDASADGNHVFFSTRQSLVFTDRDERYDVYDARVGGSLPDPPELPCESEDCRREVTQGPAPFPFVTPQLKGPPDPQPNRKPTRLCPKRSHKVTRGGKSRCLKSKPHHTKRKGR